jgi:hypothetical protein
MSNDYTSKRTVCPITRAEFATLAKALVLDVRKQGDSDPFDKVTLVPKQFSTNSIGWNGNGKITVDVGGKIVTVQVGVNFTIVGSKEMPLEQAAA